jgi:hypothetical protein
MPSTTCRSDARSRAAMPLVHLQSPCNSHPNHSTPALLELDGNEESLSRQSSSCSYVIKPFIARSLDELREHFVTLSSPHSLHLPRLLKELSCLVIQHLSDRPLCGHSIGALTLLNLFVVLSGPFLQHHLGKPQLSRSQLLIDPR